MIIIIVKAGEKMILVKWRNEIKLIIKKCNKQKPQEKEMETVEKFYIMHFIQIHTGITTSPSPHLFHFYLTHFSCCLFKRVTATTTFLLKFFAYLFVLVVIIISLSSWWKIGKQLCCVKKQQHLIFFFASWLTKAGSLQLIYLFIQFYSWK